ncbi:MAG: HAMP domain-containing sensor histidine kinase [Bacteroidota bacterium]|nr:HAMP domain-containing sensor histidine kinase [Bacteroidota bacterium]
MKVKDNIQKSNLEQKQTEEVEKIKKEFKEFAYIVSHDLRAPLRAVQGYISILEEEINNNNPDNITYISGRIKKAALSMDVLLKDILEYSRIVTHKVVIENILLDNLVNNILSDYTEKIEKKEVEIEKYFNVYSLYSDRYLLKKIISALISNAIKYSNKASKITIKLSIINNAPILEIIDRGIGIQEQYQQKIFDMFERLHGVETYSGTGTGLAIVKKSCEILSLQYGVNSETDKGSKFWIKFNNIK